MSAHSSQELGMTESNRQDSINWYIGAAGINGNTTWLGTYVRIYVDNANKIMGGPGVTLQQFQVASNGLGAK